MIYWKVTTESPSQRIWLFTEKSSVLFLFWTSEGFASVTPRFLSLGLLGAMSLLPWAVLPERVGRAAGGALGTKEGRGVPEGRAAPTAPGVSIWGEKHPPQGMERSLCCPWAHTTAGIIMALGLVIPSPHAPLMCKCSEGWPNVLGENTSEEIETSLN